MEEDIKILEEILKDKDWYKIHGGEDIGYPEVQALENLLNAYKKLEEENKDIIYEERKYQNLNPEEWDKKGFYTVKHYKKVECIPISVIQNKIDEIQNYIDNSKYNDDWNVRRVYARKVLQELLEERNK